MSLKVGVATRDITPSKPLFLCGYPHVPRTSTGVHDPLWATALYLDDGATALLLITLDILYLSTSRAAAWRKTVRERTGVPEENILLGVTHTHSGPNTVDSILAWRNDPIVPPPDEEYMNLLATSVVEASVAAKDTAIPAELAVTTADGTGVGGNRIEPNGVTDPEVGLLCFRAKNDRKPFALSLIYGMHPTVLHEDSTLVSADFPHYTRLHLQERLPGLSIAYHNGASGNQSPRHHVKGLTFAEAERLGRMLGARVYDALQAVPDNAFRDQVKLGARRGHADLPKRKFPSVADAQKRFEQAKARFERLGREGAPRAEVRTAECALFGAERAVLFAEAQAGGEIQKLQDRYSPAEVQVLQIGDTFIAGLPGEMYVEFALDLKRRAPAKTFVITMANGELQGYIVTPEAEKIGTYEAGFGIFTPAAGTSLADTAVNVIGEMVKGTLD